MLAPLVPAAIGPEDEALRAEVRAFLAERLAGVPGARRARTWMGFDADFSRDLAARGWVGLTLRWNSAAAAAVPSPGSC